jgi:hypothetical protein
MESCGPHATGGRQFVRPTKRSAAATAGWTGAVQMHELAIRTTLVHTPAFRETFVLLHVEQQRNDPNWERVNGLHLRTTRPPTVLLGVFASQRKRLAFALAAVSLAAGLPALAPSVDRSTDLKAWLVKTRTVVLVGKAANCYGRRPRFDSTRMNVVEKTPSR